MNNLLEAALDYAARGWAIFPCSPGTKIPMAGSHGFKDATTDPEAIRAIWTETPDANIAFEPGRTGQAVVDIEGNGEQDWADLLEDHLETEPETWTVRSPSGGRHLYFEGSLPGKVRPFKWPSGKALNIDTRGEGSYVLLPPSRFEGNSYEVINDAKPAPLPAFIRELTASRTHTVEVPDDVELDSPANLARARRYVDDLIRRGHVSIQGQGGNDTLYRVACVLSDFGISTEQCADLLSGEWDQACIPPWATEPEHFHATIANAYNYQKNKGSGAYASRATWEGFDAHAFWEAGGGRGPGDSGTLPDAGRRSVGLDDASGRSRFALLTEREQDELPEPQWLIPRLIPMGATVLHTAVAKTYKTFLALDIAMAIAAQTETFGVLPALAGDVVYAALEGRVGIAKLRRKAWRKARGIPDDQELPFFLTAAPHIGNPAECAEFLAVLDAHVASGHTLAMLTIDTLHKSMAGLDENSSMDSGTMLAFMDELRDRYGCTVYVVAHAGYTKEGQVRVRGSSAIPAGFETLILSERDEDTSVVKVWAEHHKDADTDNCEWYFQPRRVGGAMVMDHLTKAEASERARKLDPYTLDKIGAKLTELGASGRDKAVTTNVLAKAMTAHQMDDTEDQYQEAVAKGEKALRALAKGKAEAYCFTRSRETLWAMPA